MYSYYRRSASMYSRKEGREAQAELARLNHRLTIAKASRQKHLIREIERSMEVQRSIIANSAFY